ncbi:hypothetical protein JCM10207_007697 [Rhodosporidiobolus poonsookiae]
MASAATPAAPVVAASGPPPRDPTSSNGGMEAGDGDQTMTDDVRVAISALGLMREGSLGGSAPPASLPLPTSSSLLDSSHSLSPSTHHSRTASSSHRSDPSRSTSTASTASNSEAWTSADTTDTGFSSPVGTASLAGTGADDAYSEMDMGGLGEAEMRDGEEADGATHEDPRFMARVSQLPIVSGGIEWYERSKANSRVVKYGAGLVESSLSAVSRPIANNLQLGPLDDFACRQLDRIGAAPGSSPGRKSPASPPHLHLTVQQQQQQAEEEEDVRGRSPVRQHAAAPKWAEQAPAEGLSPHAGGEAGQVATVAQRSRWQTVLLEAGGLGAAVSEESLKSLRYCLQWLLYATAHLDHQISTLRDFILSLRAHNRQSSVSGSASSSNALIAASASAHLAQIKHDVVETIRKVVEVVSKYAGAALPEQAKRYVRQSILGLPVKWATAIEQRAGAGGGGGGGGSAAEENGADPTPTKRRRRSVSAGGMSVAEESDIGTPRPERMHESYFAGGNGAAGEAEDGKRPGQDEAGEDGAELSPTEEAADRVLTFAVESLEMLRTVTGIFGESVEKAEAWIERLRIVGLDRQRQRQAAFAAASQQQQHPYAHHPGASPLASTSAASYALPPSGPVSAVTSPSLSSSATFDDGPSSTSSAVAAATGTKRRRASTRVAVDDVGAGSSGMTAAAAAEVGATTDGEAEAAGRRKRGARREAA